MEKEWFLEIEAVAVSWDELFTVFKGCLTLQLRDHNIELNPGEMFIVSKGVEHCPSATPDTHFIMI